MSTFTSRLDAATKQRLEFVHTGFYSSASIPMHARISLHGSYSFVVVIVKGMADEISGSMTFGSG